MVIRPISRAIARQNCSNLSRRPLRSFSHSIKSSHFTPSSSPPPLSTQPNPSHQDEPTTHFGFQTLPASLKESKVASVFSSVAPSYDTMNDLMSLGVHRLWKDHFVRSLLSSISSDLPSKKTFLDIAGGTGDIAIRLLSHPSLAHNPPKITISDINPAMLSEGKSRIEKDHSDLLPQITFLEANAEHLPPSIAPDSIDLYTVAFGIRNFTDKMAALKEAYRVLKPGGVFACLEFSKVTNPLFEAAYKRWSFGVIPIVGQLVAGDRDSYQYLVESIERFPTQEQFQGMIEDAGFVVPKGAGNGKGWEDLTGGVCAIHKGVKPL